MTELHPSKKDADRLYQQYVKPLEKDHRGQYAAVSLQGQTILAATLLEVMQRAEDEFGTRQTVVFKVGAKAVGKLL
jgi:hypothetical protein